MEREDEKQGRRVGCACGAQAPRIAKRKAQILSVFGWVGNQTVRNMGVGAVYNLSYNVENRLVSVSGAYTGQYVYDGDGNRVQEIGAYKDLASGNKPTGSVSITNADVITNGDTKPDSGSGTMREYGYSSSNGLQYVKIDLGAAFPVDKIKIWHYYPDVRTYHQTKTEVSSDANCSTWTAVFDSAVSGEYAETAQGHTIVFPVRSVRCVRDYLNGSTANAGNHWVEIEVWGTTTTAYVGNLFEWNGSAQTMTKYYYAGAQRVAVRNSNGTGTDGVVYLLGDHLGSTSLSFDPILGQKLTELRYMPWGEERTSGFDETNMPTDNRYTGQKSEMRSIKLMYYGARWYDPYLNQWTSPDSIIPDPYNPLDWNRYSYARSNPIKYIDPTGHAVVCGASREGGCDDDPIHDLFVTTVLMQLKWNKLPKSQQELLLANGVKDNPFNPSLPNWTDPTPQIHHPTISPVDPPIWNKDLEDLTNFFRYVVVPFFDGIDKYQNAINILKPWYRQIRYTGPFGPVEAVISGMLQVYDDAVGDQNLSAGQRYGRAGAVAIETLVTDATSDGLGLSVGIATFPFFAGVPGYFVTAYGVSWGVDTLWNSGINPGLFPAFGLGAYP